jgi:hypothetical protein
MTNTLTGPSVAQTPDLDSWWVWFGWLERDTISGFIYGCAARNFRPPGWADDRAIDLPGGAGRLQNAP